MRFLVLCFSEETKALLLVPVLQNLVRQYSKISLTLVCLAHCQIFFHDIPGVHVVGIDLNKKYRGPWALYRLCRELNKLGPYIRGLDLNEDLNNYLLRFFFFFHNLYFTKIGSVHRQLRQLTRRRRKRSQNLPHLVERYTDSFREAGLELNKKAKTSFPVVNLSTATRALAHDFLKKQELLKQNTQKVQGIWIAFAPFAEHHTKDWPFEKASELIHTMQKELGLLIFLFGEQGQQLERLEDLHKKHPQTILAAESPQNLESEMGVLSQMDLFLGVDSLYMHLAALLGISIFSIWGPTHPYSGYGPYSKAKTHTLIQIPHEALSCRPCSLQGEKSCFRHDLACMQWISTNEIFEKIKAFCLELKKDPFP